MNLLITPEPLKQLCCSCSCTCSCSTSCRSACLLKSKPPQMFKLHKVAQPSITSPASPRCHQSLIFRRIFTVKDTRRYNPLRRASYSSCRGLWLSYKDLFSSLGPKKRAYYAVFTHFRPYLVFSSNHYNSNKLNEIPKSQNIPTNLKKIFLTNYSKRSNRESFK